MRSLFGLLGPHLLRSSASYPYPHIKRYDPAPRKDRATRLFTFKTVLSLILLGVASWLLSSCGSVACDSRTQTSLCQEFSGTSATEQREVVCIPAVGEKTDACPSEGRIGRCTSPFPLLNYTLTQHHYTGELEALETSCSDAKGSWENE